jgi:ATP-dependent DNA helicase RecQ
MPAETLTLYGLDDMALRRRQIDEKDLGDERRRVEHRRLAAMIDLCELATCRRQALLGYFGEEAAPCGTCDLCVGGAVLADATVDAQKVLSAVARTGERFGAGHLADLLCGDETDAIRRHGHARLKTFGAGRDRDRRAWMVTVRKLFAAGALGEASQAHGGFRVTEKGEAILFGRETIALRVAEQAAAPRRVRRVERAKRLDGLDDATAELFEKLRAVRGELARAEGVAAYMIFPDRTLIEMAQARPRGLDAMRAVHGVGERKLTRYGEIFARAILAES